MVDLRDVLRKKEAEITVLQQEIEAIRTVLKILEKEASSPAPAEAEPPRVIAKQAAGYSSMNIDSSAPASPMGNSSSKPWTSILQARNS